MTAIDIVFMSVTGAISLATLLFAIYSVRATSHGYRVDEEKVRQFCENAPTPDPRVIDP